MSQRLELLSITVDPDYARRLWAFEGHTVFVDLEIIGKERRQAARDTVINVHTMDDVARLAALPDRGPLLVRVNAPRHGAAEEAAAVAALGVDRVMLPMFRERAEVEAVVESLAAVDAPPPRLTLLAETQAAVDGLEDILAWQPEWVDHVHLGLNDLSLERGTKFLFEPVATGEVAEIAERVRALGRRFGFGGVGMPGAGGPVPAERILGEHVRVGSSCVILSRAFHAALPPAEDDALARGVAAVRRWEEHWRNAPPGVLMDNHLMLRDAIEAML